LKALKTYAEALKKIRSSGAGVEETSYYPALSNLLNDVGEELKPKVHCIINIRSKGAGIPDGGLFISEQLIDNTDKQISKGPIPARGAIEVKGARPEVDEIIHSKQVAKYLGRYKQVLVTNLREFVLVTEDATGNPLKGENYSLAKTEEEFWDAVKNPRKMASTHPDFEEYLKQVMMRSAPLAEPKDVAFFLAAYAREARKRVESSGGVAALSQLRLSLEESLGIEFEGDEGEHFFRGTLVQTLFYGMFSAWVLWSEDHPEENPPPFDWRTAGSYLHVPIIGALFAQIALPHRLGPLGIVEVLNWTGDALNRVDRRAFFEKFSANEAVQYFYEPFLEAFDPELRKRYGVWYTPQEIVDYMVERVDAILRDELNIEDGLANENVYILDKGNSRKSRCRIVHNSVGYKRMVRRASQSNERSVTRYVIRVVGGAELSHSRLGSTRDVRAGASLAVRKRP